MAIYNADRVGKLKASEEMLRTEVGALRRDLARHEVLDEIVGVSPEMAEVYHLINSAAASPISVLLTGETGSGKEHIARAIHRMSARADKPFLAVNCAALSEHLLAASCLVIAADRSPEPTAISPVSSAPLRAGSFFSTR